MAPRPASVILWARGSDRRGNYPDSNAMLVLLAKGKPLAEGTRLTPACVRASSVLPAPPADGRVFLLIDGALNAVRTGETPAPLTGNQKSVRLTQLLALRTTTEPLQMLAAALSGQGGEESIWSITVRGSAIERLEPAAPDVSFASQEAFFAAYDTPRCLRGGKSCVVLGDDGEQLYVEVQDTRSAPPKELQALGKVDMEGKKAEVHDLAWAQSGEAFYVLVGCPR